MSVNRRKPRNGTSRGGLRPVEQPSGPEAAGAVFPPGSGGEEAALEDSQAGPAIAMESILRVVETLAAEKGVATPEQMEALLAAVTEEDFERAREKWIASGPREHAQHLAYQAILEAESDEEAVALARRALELDPECVDALVVLAELTTEDRVDEFIALLERAVEVGRRALDEDPAEQDGEWWHLFEARPYLRARLRLADALRVSGRGAEAVGHLEELMKLDGADHQRAREPLLACYLSEGRLDEARMLLARFYDDRSAVFLWGRVLERLTAKDSSGALAALERARAQNRHAERYVTFRQQPPETKPDAYRPGTRGEAVHCLYIMGFAWAANPEAVRWVRSH